jgi:hypothetical protein
VFAWPVTMTEGRRLQRIGRTGKDPVKRRASKRRILEIDARTRR